MAYQLLDIWVAFGKGKKFKFYSINHICASLGEQKSQALPVFHALTGCDITSAFKGKGKKSAWQAWKMYTDITETFVFLASNLFEILLDESIHFRRIQRFTIVLYDKTSCLNFVDEARKDLFCHKNQAMDKIPPTKNALLHHSKCAIFQAGIPALKQTLKFLLHIVLPGPKMKKFKGIKSRSIESMPGTNSVLFQRRL